MRILTSILLFFFLFFYQQDTFAQQTWLIKGKVIDAQTKEVLPFAAIGIADKGVGTASNAEGLFEMRVASTWQNETLVCSFVGYQIFKITLTKAYQYSQAGQFVIEMQSSGELAAVTITSKRIPKVEKIMKKVIQNLTTNYPQQPYNAQVFYREWLKDSTAYVRLVEAALDVYDERSYTPIVYQKTKSGIPNVLNTEDKYFVKVNELRSSYDYSKSRKNNFYIDTEYGTTYNWVRKHQLIFDETMYERFNYELINVTSLGKETVYEISFEYKGSIDRYRKLKGKLFVNATDYAVVQLHFSYVPFATMGGYNEKERYGYQVYQKNEEHFYFKKYDDKYLVSYQSLKSEWSYYESSEAFEESKTVYFVEQLTVHANLQNAVAHEAQAEKSLQNLTYNPTFWESYNILADSPLDIQIKSDLEKRQALDKQFELKN